MAPLQELVVHQSPLHTLAVKILQLGLFLEGVACQTSQTALSTLVISESAPPQVEDQEGPLQHQESLADETTLLHQTAQIATFPVDPLSRVIHLHLLVMALHHQEKMEKATHRLPESLPLQHEKCWLSATMQTLVVT